MQQFLKVCVLCATLLAQPGNSARLQKVNTSMTTNVDPILGTAIGTISVIGSVYSMIKTRRLIKQNELEHKISEEIVSEYLDTAESGCRALSQVDLQLLSQREAMEVLSKQDPSGARLRESCANKAKIKVLQESVQQRLRNYCADSPTSMQSSCEELASANHVEDLCAMPSGKDELDRNMWTFDLARVRLDGLLTGLCDKLSGFARAAPRVALEKIIQKSPETSSLVESTAVVETGIIDWAGIIGLVYSAIGTVDFTLDMYDSAVNKNQGYGVMLDFLKEQSNAQKQTMCTSFSQYWLQAIKISAWSSALMEHRYVDAGFPGSTGNLLVLDWKYNLDKGSRWVCDHHKDCLVPATVQIVGKDNIGYSYPPDSQSCHLKGSDYYRICEPEANEVIAIAPEACFAANFGKALKASKHGGHNAWILKFLERHEGDGQSKYDEAACEQPFRDLLAAQSTADSVKQELGKTCNDPRPAESNTATSWW